MPEYLAPGVFVEEIDSGSKPIEGVGVNTAAFIGYAKSGEFNKPTFISNWSQFCQWFGAEEKALVTALCKEFNLTLEQVYSAQKASRKGWTEYANQTVERAIRDKTASVKSWREFLRKYTVPQTGLPYMEGSYLAHAVRGYYDNSGSRAYIVRIPTADDVKFLSNGSKSAEKPAVAAVASRAAVTAGQLQVHAAKPGRAGNDIRVEVEHVGEGDEFRLKISQGRTTEIYPPEPRRGSEDRGLTLASIADAVDGKSTYPKSTLVEVVVVSARPTETATRPAAQSYILEGGIDATTLPATSTGSAAAVPLTNGAALVENDFIGDEMQRSGMGGLVPIEDINFIAIPDLMAGLWEREKIKVGSEESEGEEELKLDAKRQESILDIQCKLVEYCERMGDRMAILDPLPGLSTQSMDEITMNTPYNCDHGQGTIYYPWIKIVDPTWRKEGRTRRMFCPPSGHVAGVWSRVGVERGVHKAPANEALMGAVELEIEVTKGDQEKLNPNGINCIRQFPGRGIQIWGARTLATVGNPSWKYVNVRRLFNYLEKSMDRGMQWAVFEPNDQDLWGRVRRNLSAFLFTEWMEGKLFGAVPEQAFYVKCDAETNPQEMIDLGRLYCEIGVNPVKPAEFVIIRIGQWSSGGSMGEQ